MSVYIWSDLHLNHKNILKYTSRDFQDVSEMNQTILKNWRETIKSEDTLINLGDVTIGLSKDELKKILDNLPGKKVLILGNHDRGHSVKWWHEVGFDEVYPYPIIYENFYILSHEPVFMNENMPYVNIHGHTHDNCYEQSYYINACVEHLNYSPVLFSTLIQH